MPKIANVTMNFDTHITKVFMEGEGEQNTWTVSGQVLEQFAKTGGPYPVEVTFESGYELDTVTAENATISNKTNVGFSLSFGMRDNVNCTITSKSSTPQPSFTFKHFFDAGTIGTGAVKFRHYSQEKPSSGGAVTLIDFTINGTSYQAEEGMTWEEWVNSSYNTNNEYAKSGGSIYNNDGFVVSSYINVPVLSGDIIIADTQYVLSTGGAGN